MKKILSLCVSERTITILAMLFFVEMAVFFAFSNDRAKVLVLHSYTLDYSWSQSINDGIVATLANRENIRVAYHFMDTKNASENQKLRAQKLAHRRVAEFAPDILIALDDDASLLVAKDYVGDGMEIIFAGVNGSVKPYGYEGAPNVTGIYERKPVQALVELIYLINRYQHKPTSVVFVSDKSGSAQHDAERMESANWGEHITYTGHIAVPTFAEWKTTIRTLSEDIDYLLIGGYRKLKREDDPSKRQSPEEVAHWTVQNSRPLVLGLNTFNSQDGVPMSVGVSGYEQGEVVARMALKLIKTGKRAGEFPFAHPSQYFVSMNADAMAGDVYGEIPGLLEVFARSTHHYYSDDEL